MRLSRRYVATAGAVTAAVGLGALLVSVVMLEEDEGLTFPRSQRLERRVAEIAGAPRAPQPGSQAPPGQEVSSGPMVALAEERLSPARVAADEWTAPASSCAQLEDRALARGLLRHAARLTCAPQRDAAQGAVPGLAEAFVAFREALLLGSLSPDEGAAVLLVGEQLVRVDRTRAMTELRAALRGPHCPTGRVAMSRLLGGVALEPDLRMWLWDAARSDSSLEVRAEAAAVLLAQAQPDGLLVEVAVDLAARVDGQSLTTSLRAARDGSLDERLRERFAAAQDEDERRRLARILVSREGRDRLAQDAARFGDSWTQVAEAAASVARPRRGVRVEPVQDDAEEAP